MLFIVTQLGSKVMKLTDFDHDSSDIIMPVQESESVLEKHSPQIHRCPEDSSSDHDTGKTKSNSIATDTTE